MELHMVNSQLSLRWFTLRRQEKLKINPTECKILLTEAPMNPAKNREKMVEIMFEKYGFQGVYVAIQVPFSLMVSVSHCAM